MNLADGSDSFGRHLLLWSIFLPLTKVWSVHAWWIQRRQQHQPPPNAETSQVGTANHNNHNILSNSSSTTVQSLACLALTSQIMLMYVGTVLHRTTDLFGLTQLHQSQWLPPKLSAVHYALLDAFATRDHAVKRFITSYAAVSQALTFMATVVEFMVPLVGCWLAPARYRHYGALVLVGLHVGLLSVFHLPNWQLTGMLVQSVWIPSHVWNALFKVVPTKSTISTTTTSSTSKTSVTTTTGTAATTSSSYKKTDGDPRPTSSSTTPTTRTTAGHEPPERPTPNVLSMALQVFFFGYMWYNWAGNRGWIPKHDRGDIGEGLVRIYYLYIYIQWAAAY